MKNLQLGKGWFPEESGGLNRYFYDCIHALPEAGADVLGLVAGSSQVVIESGGQVQAFASAQAPLIARWQGLRSTMRQCLKNNDVSLVVSHFGLYTFSALDLLGDRPLVVHFHGPWALESQAEGGNRLAIQFKYWLEQNCYRRAVAFVVLSNAFRQVLHHSYKIPLDKIHVVPGGVNPDHFQTNLSQLAAREALGWEYDRPILFAIRRLAKRMGLENLIQAIVQVKQKHPNVILKIAGKGALKTALQQQIVELKLTNHVQLLGYAPDAKLPLMYRAANFSVVPSVSLEGFGLIVVESMAAGTPVLGTPVGGIPEILLPLSSDLVFEGTETQQIAKGICEALSGKRKLPSTESCQSYVQQTFAWQTVAQKLQAIYVAAMEGSLK